ncbi:MAG: isoprenylcysteine carboxylmethyltransferase family protein [Pseudomonadota bacterium]
MTDAKTEADAPSRIPWPPLLLIGAVAGSVVLGQVAPLPWPGINDFAAQLIGRSIGIAGLLLMAWAGWTMYRARTNILPHKGADRLVTHGPFRRFRNPIYLADTMVLLGAAEITQNIWFAIAAAVFVPAVTWLAILPEEAHLRRRFGDEYEAYFERSRRWI